MNVLIVGQGNMGKALSDALLAKGFAVTVWNRTVEKCAPARMAGAVLAESVEEGAKACDVAITCLSNSAAVQACLTPRGVGHNLQGKALLQLSQSTVDEAEAFASWAADNGVGYLDGSIMGYPSDVRANACMIVYSGAEAMFRLHSRVLQALGANPRYVGESPGAASAFDKAFFSAFYAHIAGLLHGAAICRSAGLPLETYFELMIGGCDWQSLDGGYAEMIKSGDFTAKEATLEVHAYAYDKVSRLCEKLGIDSSLPNAIQGAMQDSIDSGLGTKEIAVLFNLFQNRSD